MAVVGVTFGYTETPIEEGFRTLLTGLAVRYYKAVAG